MNFTIAMYHAACGNGEFEKVWRKGAHTGKLLRSHRIPFSFSYTNVLGCRKWIHAAMHALKQGVCQICP